MPYDFIPRPDSDFSAWANNHYARVRAWWIGKGLPLADLNPLRDALTAWNAAYPAHAAAQAAALAAREVKDAAREGLEPQVRTIAARIQAFPTVTDADRALMGITVRGAFSAPRGGPKTRPLVRVDSGGRLTHTVRFFDESTPASRAKPRGSSGAEVRVAMTAPGEPFVGGPESMKYQGRFTRGRVSIDFPPTSAGQTAHYVLRWLSTRAEPGPWSEVASATVAA